jgi:hypothetical protein
MMTRAFGNAYVKLEASAKKNGSIVPLGAQVAVPDIVIASVPSFNRVVVASDGMDKFEFVMAQSTPRDVAALIVK